MSIFEVIMLLCFGLAWPFSIHKSYKTKTSEGKSLIFFIVIIIGYISGIINKILYRYDHVVFLYGLNATMVFVDAMLYLRYKKIYKNA